jgi:hypothetical protein
MKAAVALRSRWQRLECAKTAKNKLTADRSTTELRWISQLKETRVAIFAHDWFQATPQLNATSTADRTVRHDAQDFGKFNPFCTVA